jgi:uncharacterized membrane protein
VIRVAFRPLIAAPAPICANGDVIRSSHSKTIAMPYSAYLPLAYAHLFTVLPAFVIGTYMMLSRKGSPLHRALGKTYLILMLVTGTITLFMPAAVGPKLLNHFGFIHLFSVLTLVSVPRAYFAARRHDVRSHRNNMIGLYVGGLIIAGGFAFMPGRLLHTWLFT